MENQDNLLKEVLKEWYEKGIVLAKTSGSTGSPKEIILNKEQILRSAKRTNNFFKIGKKSRIHSCVSFEFIGGKMMIIRSLLSGCELTFSLPAVAPKIAFSGRDIDLMAVVPVQMYHLLNNSCVKEHVKHFLIGGSPIDDRLWTKIVASGIDAWESYGMTETASHIALRRIAGSCENRPRFVPFPGIKLSLDFDNCLHIVDGEINIRTNDIAKLASDGSFEIIGRKDDMIISGGIKVLPQEIEKILFPFLSKMGLEFYISAIPDECWTSKIILIIISQEKNNEEKKKEVRELLDRIPEDLLSRKLRPKDILFFKEMPLTPSGKIMRKLSVF